MRAIRSKAPRGGSGRASRFDVGELVVVVALGLVAAFISMMVVAGSTGTWSANP